MYYTAPLPSLGDVSMNDVDAASLGGLNADIADSADWLDFLSKLCRGY